MSKNQQGKFFKESFNPKKAPVSPKEKYQHFISNSFKNRKKAPVNILRNTKSTYLKSTELSSRYFNKNQGALFTKALGKLDFGFLRDKSKLSYKTAKMKKTIDAIYSKDQMLLQNIPLFEFKNFSTTEKNKKIKPEIINKRITQKLKEFKTYNSKRRSGSKKNKNRGKRKIKVSIGKMGKKLANYSKKKKLSGRSKDFSHLEKSGGKISKKKNTFLKEFSSKLNNLRKAKNRILRSNEKMIVRGSKSNMKSFMKNKRTSGARDSKNTHRSSHRNQPKWRKLSESKTSKKKNKFSSSRTVTSHKKPSKKKSLKSGGQTLKDYIKKAHVSEVTNFNIGNKENFRLSNIDQSYVKIKKNKKILESTSSIYGGSNRVLKREHFKSDLGNYKIQFLARNFKNKNSFGGSGKFQVMPQRKKKRFNTMKPDMIKTNREVYEETPDEDSDYYSARISNKSENKEKRLIKNREKFNHKIFKTTNERRTNISKKLDRIQNSMRKKKKVILDLKQFNAVKTVKRKGNFDYGGVKKSRNFEEKKSQQADQGSVEDDETLVNFSLKTEEKLDIVDFNCTNSDDKTQKLTDSINRKTPGPGRDVPGRQKREKLEIPFFSKQSFEKGERGSKKEENLFQELILSEEEQKIDLIKIRKNQKEIKWKMRAILFDWLSEVCADYQLCRDAYYYSIYYVDKFLENGYSIKKSKFQLLGLTCLMLGCKMEEVVPPSCQELVSFLSGLYSLDEMIQCELQVVKVKKINFLKIIEENNLIFF